MANKFIYTKREAYFTDDTIPKYIIHTLIGIYDMAVASKWIDWQ